MKIHNENMCNNEVRKAGLLLVAASELEMDVSGYGELAVNQNNGNVYLLLEDYSFSLYIDLGSDRIIACWMSSEDGREEFYPLEDCTTLHTLEDWAAFCQREDDYIHSSEADHA
jgi:hypothetical protein